jgi:hypothetical protein
MGRQRMDQNKKCQPFQKSSIPAKRRTVLTAFKWVKGHQGDQGNKESNRLAKEGAEKGNTDYLPLDILKEFDLQGAKLVTITQALAYRGIREQIAKTTCPSMNRNLDIIREAVKEYSRNNETDATIWRSIRKRTICLRVQQFLFKAIHNTLMIGDQWVNIQGYKRRGECATCRITEDMSHIILHCRETTVNTVWELTKKFWPHEGVQWPVLSIGTILGCVCLEAEGGNKNRRNGREWTGDDQRGVTRLLQILISEAAHLIWVLCCERVIQEKQHNVREVVARWEKAINRRLTKDKITATIIKRLKSYTRLVEVTWKDVLGKLSVLPDRWIHDCEVLVGMCYGRLAIVSDVDNGGVCPECRQ